MGEFLAQIGSFFRTAMSLPSGDRTKSVPSANSGRTVLVHAGARDSYQVALALAERDMLELLVTDLFWSEGDGWLTRLLGRRAPGLLRLLRRRGRAGIPTERIKLSPLRGLAALWLEKRPQYFELRRRATRGMDTQLGRRAGRLARRRGAGLVSYSYTGFDAIRAYGRAAMLFQVHPHPATVREILQQELATHPDCAPSLKQEWELALPEEDFRKLGEESGMAARYLAASSFTRRSLVEHGVRHEAIAVVPYGVDLERFQVKPGGRRPGDRPEEPLQLLFVGRINQRKGLKYLLEALKLLEGVAVKLTICGRVVDDLALFKPFEGQIEIRPSVSEEELVMAYQTGDLFVFPSVAEGFGQVLLEALACGLPILATTHTAAPDLIVDGVEGFIVEPRAPAELAEKIRWAAEHRSELRVMGEAARRRAEQFTWERFRAGIVEAVQAYLEDPAGERLG